MKCGRRWSRGGALDHARFLGKMWFDVGKSGNQKRGCAQDATVWRRVVNVTRVKQSLVAGIPEQIRFPRTKIPRPIRLDLPFPSGGGKQDLFEGATGSWKWCSTRFPVMPWKRELLRWETVGWPSVGAWSTTWLGTPWAALGLGVRCRTGRGPYGYPLADQDPRCHDGRRCWQFGSVSARTVELQDGC